MMFHVPAQPRTRFRLAAVIAGCGLLLGLELQGWGAPPALPPQGGAAEDIRIVSYNIKHGQGNDNVLNLERTAEVLRKLSPDIVGLQEVDAGAKRTNGVDQAARLGELLGMRHAFGKFMDYQGGGYGLAILSRYPILEETVIRLPDGNEPRVALAVRVQPPGGASFTVMTVHFDWVDDDRFRYAQAEVLAQRLDGWTGPYVLLGDFNDLPDSRTLALFRARATEAKKPAGASFTFSSTKPEREIDYVFFSPPAAFGAREVRVIDEPVASDHRPVLAVLQRR
jgi:endonuclease/exonuclease/phosphatase family metal-dependent hydrolase